MLHDDERADVVLRHDVERRTRRASPGVTVNRVPPLTRRMSLTFMAASRRSRWRINIAHNDHLPRTERHARLRRIPASTRWRCTPAPRPTRPPARARCRSTSPPRSSSSRASTPASLFNMERSGHVYSRISNPTNAVFEERMAALEGGVGAIATASGQAALHLAIATLAGAGSHVVAASALYGGSHNLLHYTLARFGIATTFVEPGDIDGWRAAIRPETRLLFGETLGNPGLDVLDIPTVAAIAHEHDLPLLVDSTFTTPWLMKPFEHGADLALPLGDQVPLRPRHGDRRRARRQRQLRLGRGHRARGRFTELTRALRRLPRHGVQRGEHRRRVPAARAPRRPARLRRQHEPAHGVAHPAGHRDAAAAHGAPRREHAQGRRLPRRARRWSRASATPSSRATPTTRSRKRLLPRGCGRRLQLRPEGLARAGAGLHRGAEDLLAPGQRRRLPLARHPPGVDHPLPHGRRGAGRAPASARARSACRSAWKTPTT